MSMTDPSVQPQAGNDPGDGAAGAPTPEDQEREALKTEIANLRETNRQEHAERLAAQHGLGPTAKALVASQPRDKQDEFAKNLAEEMKGQAPATPAADPGPAAGQPAPPAPTAPAQPDPGTDPSLGHMATGGEGAPSANPVPQGWRAQMDAEVAQAKEQGKGLTEFQEIQARYQDIARKERQGQ